MRDRDPGLQPERTRLAWRRTTLAYTVAALLAARTAVQATGRGGSTAAAALVGAVCALLWLGFLAVAHRRVRRLADRPTPPSPPPHLAFSAVLLTVALAACAVALVV